MGDFSGKNAMRAAPSGPLRGAVDAPGDKSISHRALILGAMAEGKTSVHGLLEGDDVLRTAAALRALGARIERERGEDSNVWRIEGRPWATPARPLYFGNSGTGARLVMGAVAGSGAGATFDGDASLRRRPMERVLEPLRAMGAAATSRDGRLPVVIEAGRRLCGVRYRLPAPSAQIKSAALLAALGADGETVIEEPAPCRDHTERMLPVFGCSVDVAPLEGGGRRIRVAGGARLRGAALTVPGDPSSAAFIAVAALIVPGSDVLIRGVLINPLRTGLFETLREMGADLTYENERDAAGEPVADIRVRHSALRGVEVPAARAPSMIDEYPALAVAAAFASGATEMRGLGELRVKESDRIAAVEAGLRACGVATTSGPDWLRVEGGAPAGGAVEARDDHRIAMSFLVMGLAAAAPVTVDDASTIATSFPQFGALMRSMGADILAVT